MATVLSRAIAAAAIGAALPPARLPVAVWGLGIVWSMVPAPEELELEREMEYFVEPEEAFTGRDEIE